MRRCLLAALTAGATGMSTLIGSEWNLKLNVGIEPGSYLARTGWGASEGRIIVNTQVRFEEELMQEAEELVGPLATTRRLSICGDAPTFVSMQGVQEVTFDSGGWCVQRKMGASKRDEGLLRFWLDCPSGATKGDVSIDAGERIFFSTGVFDDKAELESLLEQREELKGSLAANAAAAEARKEAQANGNLFEKAMAFREGVKVEDERQLLRYKEEFFETVPTLGKGPAAITTGPGQCGLSVKRQSGKGFFSSNVYHILGRFEMDAVESSVAM